MNENLQKVNQKNGLRNEKKWIYFKYTFCVYTEEYLKTFKEKD